MCAAAIMCVYVFCALFVWHPVFGRLPWLVTIAGCCGTHWGYLNMNMPPCSLGSTFAHVKLMLLTPSTGGTRASATDLSIKCSHRPFKQKDPETGNEMLIIKATKGP